MPPFERPRRCSPQWKCAAHNPLKSLRLSDLASVSPMFARNAAKSLIFHRPGQAPDTPFTT